MVRLVALAERLSQFMRGAFTRAPAPLSSAYSLVAQKSSTIVSCPHAPNVPGFGGESPTRNGA